MTHEQQCRIAACISACVSVGALMVATTLAAAQETPQWRSTASSQLSSRPPSQLQYVWIDDNGIKHFSDRPPAPSVSRNRMLMEPDSTPPMTQPAPLQTSEPGQKSTTPSNIAEHNADFVKRRASAAAAEQQSAQEAEQRAALARNCDDMLKNQRLLESGAPISSVASDGSRAFLSDEARALASKRNQDALARCR
jgi:type IV secretory pathway VirB10-like protein